MLQVLAIFMFLVGVAGAIFCGWAFSVSSDTKSAIHEIEALIGGVLAVLGLGLGGIAWTLDDFIARQKNLAAPKPEPK